MKIDRLPLGEQAPIDADCVRIEEQPEGVFQLTGSALCIDDDGASVSIVGGPLYASIEQAQAAGSVWAVSVGVTHLFVSIGTLPIPLKPLEIDKPLHDPGEVNSAR